LTPAPPAGLEETWAEVARLFAVRILLPIVLAACAGQVDDPAPPRAAAAHLATAPGDAGVADVAGVADALAIPSCVDDAEPYDPAVLRDHVAFLASKALDGRAPGTEGDVAARRFIANRFRCLGLVPAGKRGSFEVPFVAAGKRTANVVGYIAGTDPDVGSEIIFLGAHHDHVGKGHLGANDNASGIAALLAIAQTIRQRADAPRRTIVFAAFGGEELGMLGSYHLAADPPAELPTDRVVQFINLDMVGSHSSRKLVAAMGAFRGLAARKPLEKLVKRYPRLHVAIGGRARGSDYEPYCKRGVPYVFFWTPDARCYHATCDTADRLDYPRMADIASLAGALALELADSPIDLLAARTRRGCGL
jgi:hypothetical protein